jgi:3-oxoacyl-[acyl-carrier-protein] synthase-3
MSNEEMSRIVDTSDEWIRKRTGIVTRRVAGPGRDHRLARHRGARAALADAGIRPDRGRPDRAGDRDSG